MKRLLTLALCLPLAIRGEENKEDPFFYVDLTNPPFDASQVVAEDRILTVLRSGATILSRNIIIPNRTRAQLVAVSLAIDPEHKPAYTTNLLLRQKEQPPPFNVKNLEGEPIDLNRIAQDLLAATYEVYGDVGNQKNKNALILVAMLYDICSTIYPSDPELKYSYEIFLENNKPAPWDQILKPSDGAAAAEKPANPELTMRRVAVRGLEMKRKKAEVKNLRLTLDMTSGFAGNVGEMSATHMENVRDTESVRRLRLDHREKDRAAGGLEALATFMEIRHGDWIKDGVIEFGFLDEKLMRMDESIGLACALMVEELVTGDALDPKFSCSGALGANGSITISDAVIQKLRGARTGACELAVLPNSNRYALADLALLGEAALVAEVQIFLVENFDQAWSVAKSERPAGIATSIAEFDQLRARFRSEGVMETIRSESGKAALRRILERTPNHGSAQLMLAAANGQLPKQLSLRGSMEELERQHRALTLNLNLPPDLGPKASHDLKFYQDLTAEFEKLNARVDPRAKEFSDALLKLAEAMEEQKRVGKVDEGTQLKARGDEALKGVGEQMAKIQADPQLLEAFEQMN